MPRQGKERATGPYQHGNRFRIVFFAASGASETVSFETEAQAIKERDAYNAAAGSRTIGEAVAEYLKEHATSRGIATTRYRLLAILRLKDGDRPLSALTAPLARQLYTTRTSEVAVDTHRGELAYVTRFCQWCIDRGWIRVNPFADIVPVGVKKRGKPKLRVNATRAYIAVLMRDPSLEATAVLMALTLGLRANEVVKRTVEDVDDDGWLLWIRESKTEGSDREIEIPDYLRARLLPLIAGRPPGERIFGSMSRHALHYHTVKFCRLAGVPRVTPHGLRGSGATNKVRGGNSLEDVAAWLGHTDDGDTAKAHYIGGGAVESARGRMVREMIPLDVRAPKTHRAGVPDSYETGVVMEAENTITSDPNQEVN